MVVITTCSLRAPSRGFCSASQSTREAKSVSTSWSPQLYFLCIVCLMCFVLLCYVMVWYAMVWYVV